MSTARKRRATPGWVKAFAVVALFCTVLFIVLHAAGMGFGGHLPLPGHGAGGR